ncbi:hypothetical protein DFH11DRAFT_88698 [Phellopilus nigrolimitatus]|nr:hypothetical protein DFH11DRAFT_88698 [Phellopilus nigrolimitatus]
MAPQQISQGTSKDLVSLLQMGLISKLLFLGSAYFLNFGVSAAVGFPRALCTLEASGGDDAPSFVSAVLDPSCSTVEIPAGATLNISTKMDMTGTQDKHILLEGTVKFNPDIDYWVANAFPITFR